MKTSATCPACGNNMSLWDGMKAPTPFHFRCPHCTARLRIQMRGLWPLLILVVCLFAGLAVGCIAAWRKFGARGLLIALVCYAAASFAAEVTAGIVFYTYGTFTRKGT